MLYLPGNVEMGCDVGSIDSLELWQRSFRGIQIVGGFRLHHELHIGQQRLSRDMACAAEGAVPLQPWCIVLRRGSVERHREHIPRVEYENPFRLRIEPR